MKPILIFLSLLIVVFSRAAEGAPPSGLRLQALMNITSDQDRAVTKLSAMIDEQERLVGIFSEVDTTKYEEIFWLKDVEKKEGVVLFEQEGYEVLKLRGGLDRVRQEGTLVVKYLTNGLLNAYRDCKVGVRKGEDSWYIQNLKNGKAVKSVQIETGRIGVKKLKGLCQ